MLTPSRFAILVIVFMGRIYLSYQKINWIPLISKAAGANDVITFALNAVDFFSGTSSSEDKFNTDIEEAIDNSKTEILDNIILQSRFDKIDDAVIAIHSSLVDLQSYRKATSIEKTKLKAQYIKRFDDNSVISQIRFLPELLSYSVPGTRGETFMSLFSTNANCDSGKIKRFQKFYLRLVSDGVALDVIHTEFSNLDPSTNVEFWAEKMEKIRGIFEQANDECWTNKDDVAVSKVAFAFIISK